MPTYSEIPQETAPTQQKVIEDAHRVLYDGQCEICQAGVSWLKVLDRSGKIASIPISPEVLPEIDKRLDLESCLKQLHVVTPEGEIRVAWEAVTCLARMFPSTWLIAVLGEHLPFRVPARSLYNFVAKNRYSLSKCRGGACHVARPDAVKSNSRKRVFWACYTFGFLMRLPLVLWAGVIAAIHRVRIFSTTYQKRLDLLNGKLTILFLNGLLPNTVPLLFGEMFTAIIYNGVAIDPGSPKMRRSLVRHVRRGKLNITKIVATHAHEEHVGNLNWLSETAGAPIYVSELTARFLRPFKKLPFVRAAIIGQPPNLSQPYSLLGATLAAESGILQVIPTPGHCEDHVALYDRKEKILLAGDAFMGSYFATPNPDVDSRKWVASLESLMELDIEILIEGHGHVYTLRSDISDLPGVVVRENPKVAIAAKLEFLRWLREQIDAGIEEKLPLRMVEASCFPWGKRTSWETCATDECIRMLSLGHFSRTELIRSFIRTTSDALPTVYEIRMSGD